jgi:hypothetical protein
MRDSDSCETGDWRYTPSCPCRRCEQHRADNTMTVNSWPDGLAETNTKAHHSLTWPNSEEPA